MTMGKAHVNLHEIDCSHNRIETLDNLPKNLVKINCSNNHIRSLDNLPEYLDQLNCSHNFIIGLTNLPQGLSMLDCSDNIIRVLSLPKFLKILNCSFNLLKILENIPLRIEEIYCTDNMICSISTESNYKLNNLRVLCCDNNRIQKINFLLFPSLEIVDCSCNLLEELKDLPLGLRRVISNNNMIKFVSDINGHMPDYLEYFDDMSLICVDD